jgi:hypothetical protein
MPQVGKLTSASISAAQSAEPKDGHEGYNFLLNRYLSTLKRPELSTIFADLGPIPREEPLPAHDAAALPRGTPAPVPRRTSGVTPTARFEIHSPDSPETSEYSEPEWPAWTETAGSGRAKAISTSCRPWLSSGSVAAGRLR